MRPVKFGENNLANELARMSDTDLDSLAFGAIDLDGDGKIIRYNAAEADISSREQAGMVGRNFFSDVAPCTRSEAFEGRFRTAVKAGRMDIQFTYVLDHKMLPTEVRVRVRMHQAEGKDTYWVLIKRVTATAVQ
jgi:photoactive yellow protein